MALCLSPASEPQTQHVLFVVPPPTASAPSPGFVLVGGAQLSGGFFFGTLERSGKQSGGGGGGGEDECTCHSLANDSTVGAAEGEQTWSRLPAPP